MVTPKDLRRMLARASDNHTQNTPSIRVTPLDVARMKSKIQPQQTEEEESIFVDISGFSGSYTVENIHVNITESRQQISSINAPSPALMPQRRVNDGPKTFASLDAQDLPIVREYSAGGLVFDSLGRVAVIARHSRSGHMEWCLPKGHIEKGESL